MKIVSEIVEIWDSDYNSIIKMNENENCQQTIITNPSTMRLYVSKIIIIFHLSSYYSFIKV